ncbi:hypothetical protein EDD22DRAFT_950521 [Suillus occidentalis]|nr:hypothetical protein EDD22DRAFT_950521 [Suillus occidentalis]
MPLVYEILLEIFKYVHVNGNPSSFTALLKLNRAYSDIALSVLWAGLNSLEPLLHLVPDHVIQRRSVDGGWRYTILDVPSTSDLHRFYLYSPLIWAIKLRGPSIAYDIVDGFTNILHHHRHTLSPLFPCLTHLEFSCTHDPLLAFLPNIIHSRLRMLTLPYDNPLLNRVMPCLLRVLPPIQALAYVSTSLDAQDFVKNIHLFPFLHDLTISPTLDASDLQTVMSHPCLQTLTLVISSTLPALHTSQLPKQHLLTQL